MKEENKRKNIKEELSHADESLQAARILIDAKLLKNEFRGSNRCPKKQRRFKITRAHRIHRTLFKR